MFVCLSFYEHIFGLRVLSSPNPNLLCVLPRAVVRFSFGGFAICYLLPVLWMTLQLHIYTSEHICFIIPPTFSCPFRAVD